MGFRLVSKSLSLNDLEWRNAHYFALFYVAFVANYVKVLPSTDFLPKNVIKYTN